MNRLLSFALPLVALTLLIGCGGSNATAPMAEQDELAKYAAENPAPPETPVD
ncbi:hypothetical protein SH528x_000191 [Novipirellula sp. SH528]|uniref:hypothetical protein n=1 Tax=Novipirellula sp. SH528 TaxID=3454466 RepID=UPI003FA0087C